MGTRPEWPSAPIEDFKGDQQGAPLSGNDLEFK